MVALVFRGVPQSNALGIVLVLGADEQGSTAPIHTARLTIGLQLQLGGKLRYDNSVARGVFGGMVGGWQTKANPTHPPNRLPWGQSAQRPIHVQLSSQVAQMQHGAHRLVWCGSSEVLSVGVVRHGQARDLGDSIKMAWWYGRAQTASVRLVCVGGGFEIHQMVRMPWLYTQPRHQTQRIQWSGRAKEVRSGVGLVFSVLAQRFDKTLRIPWQNAQMVLSRGGVFTSYRPPPSPPWIQERTTNLLLCCKVPLWGSLAVNLVLGKDLCQGGGEVPQGRLFILPFLSIMQAHTITAKRLPDGLPLDIYDVSISADMGSIGWSFSASGSALLMQQLAPAQGLPAQIAIVINGIVWRFVVESLRLSRKFGSNTVSVGGRSITALLASPWQRVQSYTATQDTTAQQLAAKALDLTGCSLDWALEDWVIPFGAYSHEGTPLSAVQTIAESAGGYLQSDKQEAILQVRHPYPTLVTGDSGGYWNWGIGVADVAVSADAIIAVNIERRDVAPLNAVYVGGTNVGILAHVVRAGSAGDWVGQTILDGLITQAPAAKQRALSVISATGAQQQVEIEMPVMTGVNEPGVIDVGALVQINEDAPWRGRVRSVRVDFKRPTLRQTIVLERHL